MKSDVDVQVRCYSDDVARTKDRWSVFIGPAGGLVFVRSWKTEAEAETHAEIIRCAMAWEPSRAGRRWRSRTKPGRRAGDKGAT